MRIEPAERHAQVNASPHRPPPPTQHIPQHHTHDFSRAAYLYHNHNVQQPAYPPPAQPPATHWQQQPPANYRYGAGTVTFQPNPANLWQPGPTHTIVQHHANYYNHQQVQGGHYPHPYPYQNYQPVPPVQININTGACAPVTSNSNQESRPGNEGLPVNYSPSPACRLPTRQPAIYQHPDRSSVQGTGGTGQSDAPPPYTEIEPAPDSDQPQPSGKLIGSFMTNLLKMSKLLPLNLKM